MTRLFAEFLIGFFLQGAQAAPIQHIGRRALDLIGIKTATVWTARSVGIFIYFGAVALGILTLVVVISFSAGVMGALQ